MASATMALRSAATGSPGAVHGCLGVEVEAREGACAPVRLEEVGGCLGVVAEAVIELGPHPGDIEDLAGLGGVEAGGAGGQVVARCVEVLDHPQDVIVQALLGL